MPRTKGAIGRPKRQLLALLQEKYPGYQPVLEVAKAAHKLSELAQEAHDSQVPEERANAGQLWRDAGTAHEKVAQYVTPKLKAVTVTGPDDGALKAKISVITGEMSAEEATSLYMDMLGEN